MKAALVNKFFYRKGGQEAVMLEEAELLKARGHEIAYFSMHHPNNPEYKYDKYFADYVELSDSGKNHSFFEKINIAKNFIYNPKAAAKFQEFINDFQPDIIHCHGITHQLTPSILEVAKKHNIPVVQTLHDYQIICPNYSFLLSGKEICLDKKCAKGNYLNCILNKCIKNSYPASILGTAEMFINYSGGKYINLVDKFISPSKFLRQSVIDSGVSENKIEYIPNFSGVDVEESEIGYENYFLFAGRLSHEKGVFTLLKAFKDLPEAKLKLIGTGPIEEELKNYQNENAITNVEFLGYKSGSELQELFKNALAVIIPSEWYENAPMSILEAFSYSKCVIGSNLGGIPEMIINNKTGYLFNYSDEQGLKEKINSLAKNPELAISLGKNAKTFANENFSKESHINKLEALYLSLVVSK